MIQVIEASKYAHKAIFTDNKGKTREVFTLNGPNSAKSAAILRLGGETEYIKPPVRVKDVKKFNNKLSKRRKRNKLANKSRAKNH